jgi:hypothetical protein
MALNLEESEELYGVLRRAILEKLKQQVERRRPSGRGAEEIDVRIHSLLPDFKFPPLDQDTAKAQVGALIYQVYHELYLERIIFPGSANPNSSNPTSWPYYQITNHGRRVLETIEYSPYDPDGYLRRLKSEVPGVDETLVRYVDESLRCLRADCLLAAAVTIGCASEKAMLLLIEQFGQAISNVEKKQKYDEETSSWIITRKYRAFRSRLDGIANQLPKELSAPLEQQLHGVFDLIRQIRNDAGHPTGDPITRDAILASHIVFPGYCKYTYALKDYFTRHTVSL